MYGTGKIHVKDAPQGAVLDDLTVEVRDEEGSAEEATRLLFDYFDPLVDAEVIREDDGSVSIRARGVVRERIPLDDPERVAQLIRDAAALYAPKGATS